MGMYDAFLSDGVDICPGGHYLSNGYGKVTEYQTKGLDRMMEYYQIGDKVYVHGRRINDERIWVYDWCKPCQKMVGRWAIIIDDTFVGFEGGVQYES